MKIAVYTARGNTQPRLGRVVDEAIQPLEYSGDLEGLLAATAADRERLTRAADASPHSPIALNEVALHAPLRHPGKILAVGLNYADHRAESPMGAKRAPYPEGFVKLSSSIVGPHDPIVMWPEVTELDYEVELVAVIGRTAHNVSTGDALDYVAGYMVANDVSARDWQRSERSRGRSPLMGKSFPSFCPLGPWFVTADEIPDPQDLELTLRVNDDVRQSASTTDMEFTVADAVAHWSKLRLDPGDMILTGTPSGVAWGRKPDPAPYFLRVGDIVEATVEGIGALRNPVVGPPQSRTREKEMALP